MGTLNATTSTWAQVGDMMLRSDGTTVQPVSTATGSLIWTVTTPTGMTMCNRTGCPVAYTDVDQAMSVADAL